MLTAIVRSKVPESANKSLKVWYNYDPRIGLMTVVAAFSVYNLKKARQLTLERALERGTWRSPPIFPRGAENRLWKKNVPRLLLG